MTEKLDRYDHMILDILQKQGRIAQSYRQGHGCLSAVSITETDTDRRCDRRAYVICDEIPDKIDGITIRLIPLSGALSSGFL